MESRRYTRRILAAFLSLIILHFGTLVWLVFRDNEPPDDVHLFSSADEASGTPNPLSTVMRVVEINEYPAGFNSQQIPALTASSTTDERQAAYREFIDSAPVTWRWPREHLTVSTAYVPQLELNLHLTNDLHRSLKLTGSGNLEEVTQLALHPFRSFYGLTHVGQDTILFNVVNSMYPQGLHHLGNLVTRRTPPAAELQNWLD